MDKSEAGAIGGGAVTGAASALGGAAVWTAFVLASCSPATGPVGIHAGDMISVHFSGERTMSGAVYTVEAVGPDWIQIGGYRYPEPSLKRINVLKCPHVKDIADQDKDKPRAVKKSEHTQRDRVRAAEEGREFNCAHEPGVCRGHRPIED